jgi:hypothetical protein
MLSTENKVNKSEFIRNILRDIGALSDNPPEGWRTKVEEALKENKIELSNNYIYNIRTKAMQDAGTYKKNLWDSKRKSSKRKFLNRKKALKNNGSVVLSKSYADVTLKQLQSVRSFAEKLGGIDNLAKIIDALKNF